ARQASEAAAALTGPVAALGALPAVVRIRLPIDAGAIAADSPSAAPAHGARANLARRATVPAGAAVVGVGAHVDAHPIALGRADGAAVARAGDAARDDALARLTRVEAPAAV